MFSLGRTHFRRRLRHRVRSSSKECQQSTEYRLCLSALQRPRSSLFPVVRNFCVVRFGNEAAVALSEPALVLQRMIAGRFDTNLRIAFLVRGARYSQQKGDLGEPQQLWAHHLFLVGSRGGNCCKVLPKEIIGSYPKTGVPRPRLSHVKGKGAS